MPQHAEKNLNEIENTLNENFAGYGCSKTYFARNPRCMVIESTSYSHGKKDTDPHNISPIEMRSLLMEIKYIQSDARLLDRD